MNDILIAKLRNKKTPTEQFRDAAEKLAFSLALQTLDQLESKEVTIETPIRQVKAQEFNRSVVIVPILRAGLALLHPFLSVFPHARVGLIGMRREELSAIAHPYYENLPAFSPTDEVLLVDPMLATGGSAVKAIELLLAKGVREEQITGVFMISAPDGIAFLKNHYSKIRLIIAQEDEKLTPQKFIDPGLGDFGDRFFGTL